MKKIYKGLLFSSIFTCAVADKVINLDSQAIICNNYRITYKSLPFDVAKNCQTTNIKRQNDGLFKKHLKIDFYADNINATPITCEFKGNNLTKCKSK